MSKAKVCPACGTDCEWWTSGSDAHDGSLKCPAMPEGWSDDGDMSWEGPPSKVEIARNLVAEVYPGLYRGDDAWVADAWIHVDIGEETTAGVRVATTASLETALAEAQAAAIRHAERMRCWALREHAFCQQRVEDANDDLRRELSRVLHVFEDDPQEREAAQLRRRLISAYEHPGNQLDSEVRLEVVKAAVCTMKDASRLFVRASECCFNRMQSLVDGAPTSAVVSLILSVVTTSVNVVAEVGIRNLVSIGLEQGASRHGIRLAVLAALQEADDRLSRESENLN